jgi:hypothetical protein
MEHWLLRALQLDSRAAFQSPQEAHLAFESMLATERSYVTTPTGLEAFVAKVGAVIDRDRMPLQPPAAPAPALEPALRLVETPPQPAHSRAMAATAPVMPPMVSTAAAPALALVPPPAVVAEPAIPAPVEPAVSDAPAPVVAPAQQKLDAILSLSHASGSEETSEPVEVPTPGGSLLGPNAPATPPASRVTRSALMLTLVALAMLQSGVLMYLWSHPPGTSQNGLGDLVIQSRPASARVIVDGEDRGVTPTSLRLPAGAHVLEIRVGKSDSRVIPVTINAGVQTAQYIELQSVPLTGGVELRSQPAGAKVVVDGQKRGVTPIRLNDLPPGEHEISFEGSSGSVKQKVHIDAGITTQVTARMPAK